MSTIKKSYKNITSKVILTFVALSLFAFAAPAFAQDAPCGDTCSTNGGQSTTAAAAPTSDANCNTSSPTQASLNACLKHNAIVNDLNVVVNVLSALVGIVVTGVIILGGVQYSMAGDTPDAVSRAKQRITNGLTALAAFLLVYAFLQWIIPGGVFS